MRINKIIFGFTVAMVALLTSCSQDNESAIYNIENDGLSFTASTLSTVEVSASNPVFTVKIIRGNAASAATGAITASGKVDGADFAGITVSNYSFAPGETSTTVSVDVSSLGVGQSLALTLSIADENAVSVGGIQTTTLTVRTAYNWISAGSCTFVDYTFSDGASASNVPIQHAEGTNIYRIVQPFIAVFGPGAEGFTTDTGIQFTLNSDNTINFIVGNDDVICKADQYEFCWVADYVDTYCKLFCDGNYYEAEMLGVIDGEGYYTGFAFAFEWTTGWPGK